MNLWEQLETKKISREELPTTLFKKLGEPKNELQTNLCTEIIKKQRKEGPKKGQSFYVLILGSKDKLHAYQENLKTEQWTQITKLALLGQNLVFQYRKSFFNKEILGRYLAPKKSQK